LTDTELRHVWMAAQKFGGPYGALVKLLILTGQRRDEVARLPWSEIDMQTCVWALPPERTKNNRPHEIPLSEAAIAVLESLPRIGDRFAITTDGLAPSSNYAKNQIRLKALLPADMPHWQLHDIRRTVSSGMARLGIALPVIEKALNHASGSFAGIVGVYQRHSFAEEKRRALEAWGNYVTALVSDRPRKNVVALRKGRAHA
jgi:integrase